MVVVIAKSVLRWPQAQMGIEGDRKGEINRGGREQERAISGALQHNPWETRPINHVTNPLFHNKDHHAAGS